MNPKHLPYEIDPKRNKAHFYETLWKTVALDLLEKHAGPQTGKSLLDFGCGRGETMKFAAERGMIPKGTDTDPKCVELASAYGESVILDTERTLEQFGEKSFDIVASFHVLEHVPRPMETLQNLRRIAREWVLIAVPNLSRPRDMLYYRNWDSSVNEGHIQSWDHSHFRNMAERFCGLEVVSWGFDATVVLPWSCWIQRVFGARAAVYLETGIFKRIWPYGSTSVIALMRPSSDEKFSDH